MLGREIGFWVLPRALGSGKRPEASSTQSDPPRLPKSLLGRARSYFGCLLVPWVPVTGQRHLSHPDRPPEAPKVSPGVL